MARPDFLVVGGGIAGLAISWRLASRGHQVHLFEQEQLVASHSSARNAAIWLPVDSERSTATLARLSQSLLDELVGERAAWLRACGAYVTAEHDDAFAVTTAAAMRFAGEAPRLLDQHQLWQEVPLLRGGSATAAAHLPYAGELDIHAMCSALRKRCLELGVTLTTSAQVATLTMEGRRLRGLCLLDGSVHEAPHVVLAPGAWAQSLARSANIDVPLQPLRRHLVQLEHRIDRNAAVIWHVDPEVYFRPEAGGVLASPCDESAHQPCLPPGDPASLDSLGEKLARVAPLLAGAAVRRSWACLRTFAPDRELVLGPDPQVPGLVWLAGLGGRGMTVGVGAAELTARLIEGEDDALREVVTVDRLQ